MKIEKINISEITEYENNAKLHPREQIEQIKKSIQEFGNNDPIAIDENNVIIEGHGRYKALQELGFDEVEVIRLSHMDDEQKRAYILAHNKLTMNSGFDIELLNSELESIVNIDMEDFGFDYYEPESEVEEDDFEVEETKEPIAKLGDIYQLGRHRLMCGDSTDPDQLAKLVDGQQIDLIVTDPPYNVAYEGGTEEALTIMNDSMDNESFRKFLRDAFFAADTVLREGGHSTSGTQIQRVTILEVLALILVGRYDNA
nr:MAG TPA: ParB protein [Caudoviricetes sp.]